MVRARLAVSVVLASAIAGCQPSTANEARREQERVRVPDGWTAAGVAPSVPGVLLAAWSGPENATLVLYRTLGVPAPNPEALARELANRLTNLPEARVLRAEAIDGPGGRLAFVEAVAPGDGGRLAPSGLGVARLDSGSPIPTRQISVGRPGMARTLWLVAHYPDAAHERLGSVLEQTLRGWDPGPVDRMASPGY
jgi:hypothetical protein